MNSSQLELELEDVRVRIPWEGVSPRALTKGASLLYLNREGPEDDRKRRSMGQYDFWLPNVKAPRFYRGAPLLLPLLGG